MYSKIYDTMINIYEQDNIQITGDIQNFTSEMLGSDYNVLMAVKIFNTVTKDLLYEAGNMLHLRSDRLTDLVEDVILIINNCQEDVFSTDYDKMVKNYITILDLLFVDKNDTKFTMVVKRIKQRLQDECNKKLLEDAKQQANQNDKQLTHIVADKGLTYYRTATNLYLIKKENVDLKTCEYLLNEHENGNTQATEYILKVVDVYDHNIDSEIYHDQSYRNATNYMLEYIKSIA